MYFTKFFALSAITTLAAATVVVKRTGGGGGNEGAPGVRCCETVTTASDPAAVKACALLGIVVQDVNALVGLNCSPITVVGGGNGACSGIKVTCTDNSHDNLISLGCVPVTV
ncbi:hypothetical protein PQX77_012310 [Marasmius sp. AFHP31]|nr:hypothetical protein PQX77_012310 [Marasmius sp. AFHP31]